jgi:hypothetical protein
VSPIAHALQSLASFQKGQKITNCTQKANESRKTIHGQPKPKGNNQIECVHEISTKTNFLAKWMDIIISVRFKFGPQKPFHEIPTGLHNLDTKRKKTSPTYSSKPRQDLHCLK